LGVVQLSNVERLGNQFSIPIPKDQDGFIGRECPRPDCEGYFKIKPGTGLLGEKLPCHCPYCGHTSPHDEFWTKEQIEYAKSLVLRQFADAVRKDLKSLEFDHKPIGPFGIGLSMKVKHGPSLPIKHYREQALETYVRCDICTLEYSVFGVFAYCPDCGIHNSLQTLRKNIELIRKQLDLAAALESDDLRERLVEDALENCVSSFDGFGRECCRIRAHLSSKPEQAENVSFQNLPSAAKRLRSLFNVDLENMVVRQDWYTAHIQFMRRHLISRRAGVVDQKYLDETGDTQARVGRKVTIQPKDVELLASILGVLGSSLVSSLPNEA
jgi:hypothetical protein